MRGVLSAVAFLVSLVGCLWFAFGLVTVRASGYESQAIALIMAIVGLLAFYFLRRSARAAIEERRHREQLEALKQKQD